jgi:YD repeat-containing protein
VGDVFKYDLAAQAIGVQLNVPTPQNVQSIPQTISYDANGNRTDFHPYGTTETYAINNLSQYISRTIGNVTSNAVHDNNGNPIVSLDGGSYSYDAQNRLVTASKNGVTMSLAYDGLNRQVRRTVTGGLSIGGGTTFNVWDGWGLPLKRSKRSSGVRTKSATSRGRTGSIPNCPSTQIG